MRRYYHDTEYVLESGTENDEPTTTTAAGGSVVYYFTRTGTITTQYVSDVALVNEYTGFDQIKSKIDMDTAGNFVISWTSYQNRVFGTDNPVADGIYARQYINTADYYAALGDYYGISTDEDSENTTNPPTGTTTATAGATSPPDGIPPAVDGAATGDGTTTPPTTTPSTTTPPAATDPVTTDPAATDVTVTDTTAAPGIYATGNFAEITGWIRGYFPVSEDFRHANVEIKTGSIGGAFKVNALSSADLNSPALDNQRGGSVTVNANGDMIFVWTDLNDESTPDAWDARVTYRTITNGEEDVPPTVTTVTAAFGDPGTESGKFSNVSLMGDIVTFTKDHGPSAVIYTFSELMYAKEFILQVYDDVNLDDSEYPTSPHLTTLYASQDSTTRSVLNRTNWTMLCNNIPVTSSEIETIYYGLNAGYELGYSVDESGQYELVIVFTEQLQEGAYSITTKDIVTDLSKNRLDGNYDGVAGGSFTVRFNVGVSGVPSSYDDDDDNETDEETFANQTINHIDPEVVAFADGSYIIVTETNNDSVDDDNDDTVTGDDEGDEYTSNIVIRKFNASGEPDSADIIVNSYREGIQEDPDIDGYDYENFAVAWTGEGKDGKGVYVRFYNSGGQSTKEIRVNDVYLNGSNNRTYSAQVAFDDSSDAYLITWRQQKGANYVVLGKYYSVTGKELSRQFVVAEPTYMSMDHYHVSCQNGHYGIAWSEYLVSTNSTEVYAKTFTKAFGSWSITTRANTFMVNQTTSGSQYQVCADLDNDGNLYITWTSTQNLSTTDWDIYMRSFTFTGTPKVNETKVNQISFTDPFDSRQCEAYVSVDPEGAGYVITWSSKNTEGINYDIDLRTQLYDYGIMGCAFTADGQSINVDTGEPMNPYDATFVANKIINGNQRNSVVSVYGWDNGVPQFVVAWEGPLKVYDDDETDNTSDEEGGEPGSTITPIAGPNTNADDNRDLTYSEYTMVFHRCFPKRSSAMVVDIENALSSSSDATDLLLKDRLTDNASGSNGYYRPSNTEMLISNADLVNTAETVEIAGTEGNDLLEIITNAAGTSWTIYLNGTKVSGITAGSRIVFRGNAGTDKIAYSGSNSDSIMVNGITSSARFTGMAGALTANNVEQFEISGGGSETLTVYTTGAGDRVTVGNGDLKLTSSSRFSVTASNIEEVAVRGSSSDVAVILDSRESDTVLTRDGYVGMTGGGMVSEVYGIGNVRVLSENGGTDTITFERITGLLASQGQIVTQTPSMLVTAIGFDSINASGDVSATASLVGSKKADTFVGDSKSVVFTYNDGKMVSLSGIRSISITGNGGEDAATIVGDTGVNTLTARNGSATLTGNTYSRTINGFTKVNIGRPDESINSNYTAIVYDSVMDDTIVEEDNLVTVDFGGQEIYSLIAFDQISAKKEMNEGTDTTVSRNKLASIVFGNWN
jgi:hypothetical protein